MHRAYAPNYNKFYQMNETYRQRVHAECSKVVTNNVVVDSQPASQPAPSLESIAQNSIANMWKSLHWCMSSWPIALLCAAVCLYPWLTRNPEAVCEREGKQWSVQQHPTIEELKLSEIKETHVTSKVFPPEANVCILSLKNSTIFTVNERRYEVMRCDGDGDGAASRNSKVCFFGIFLPLRCWFLCFRNFPDEKAFVHVLREERVQFTAT